MIDFDNLKLGVAQAIRASIGSKLSQQTNPDEPANPYGYGSVMMKRPRHEGPIPEYPYAAVDIVSKRDEGTFLNNSFFDAQEDGIGYETIKIITFQVTIFDPDDSFSLASELEASFRRPEMMQILRDHGDMGIVDISDATQSPTFYDTDFIEQSLFLLEVRVNDFTFISDTDYSQAIENINSDSELLRYEDDPSPLDIDINVSSP